MSDGDKYAQRHDAFGMGSDAMARGEAGASDWAAKQGFNANANTRRALENIGIENETIKAIVGGTAGLAGTGLASVAGAAGDVAMAPLHAGEVIGEGLAGAAYGDLPTFGNDHMDAAEATEAAKILAEHGLSRESDEVKEGDAGASVGAAFDGTHEDQFLQAHPELKPNAIVWRYLDDAAKRRWARVQMAADGKEDEVPANQVKDVQQRIRAAAKQLASKGNGKGGVVGTSYSELAAEAGLPEAVVRKYW